MAENSRILSRIAGWIALGYSLAIAVFLLWGTFQDSDGTMLLLSLILIPWLASPVVIAAALAGASPTSPGAAFFLALELSLILSVVLIIVDFTYIHPSSTGGIALLVWPLFQLSAIIVIFLLALLFGWRMRPDFLKE